MAYKTQQSVKEHISISIRKSIANPKLPLAVALVSIALAISGILLLHAIQPAPAVQTPPPTSPQSQATSPLPVISLRYQGKTYQGVQGSFCWPTGEGGEGVALCNDTEFPKSDETIVVEKGSKIEVLVEAAAAPESLGLSVLNAQQSFIESSKLTPGLTSSFSADQAVGIYYLLISGSWSEGDINYGFKVKEVSDDSEKIKYCSQDSDCGETHCESAVICCVPTCTNNTCTGFCY